MTRHTYRYRGRWNRRWRNLVKLEFRRGNLFADVRAPSPERWADSAVTP